MSLEGLLANGFRPEEILAALNARRYSKRDIALVDEDMV